MLKIFITDLAGYNSGRLRGKFLTLPMEEKELEASIKNILKFGDEYFITDYEFEDIELFKIEEFDNPYELNKKIALLEDVEPYQYKIVKVLLDNGFASSLEDAIDKIDNVIVHPDSSMESIAEDYISEIIDLDSLPPLLSGHIDFKGIGRDMEIDCNFIRENSDIFEIIE
jgi:hypothetical protein